MMHLIKKQFLKSPHIFPWLPYHQISGQESEYLVSPGILWSCQEVITQASRAGYTRSFASGRSEGPASLFFHGGRDPVGLLCLGMPCILYRPSHLHSTAKINQAGNRTQSRAGHRLKVFLRSHRAEGTRKQWESGSKAGLSR
jgi:hypothetical protein